MEHSTEVYILKFVSSEQVLVQLLKLLNLCIREILDLLTTQIRLNKINNGLFYTSSVL